MFNLTLKNHLGAWKREISKDPRIEMWETPTFKALEEEERDEGREGNLEQGVVYHGAEGLRPRRSFITIMFRLLT